MRGVEPLMRSATSNASSAVSTLELPTDLKKSSRSMTGNRIRLITSPRTFLLFSSFACKNEIRMYLVLQ